MEQRAKDNGLLASADSQAREAVDTLLRYMPGIDVYTLQVE